MAVFKFTYGDVEYELELRSKLNVLTGPSGSGKTALCSAILNANAISDTGITVIQDYGVDLTLFKKRHFTGYRRTCFK